MTCPTCKSLEGMVAVDQELYHHLLKSSGLTVKDKPTFTPDEDIGEGEATPEELEYRSALLLLLSALYTGAVKVIKSDKKTPDKIKTVDKLLDNFNKQSQTLAEKYPSSFYAAAIKEANTKLKALERNLNKVDPGEKLLQPILLQQLSNLEDITNYIRGRLITTLRLNDVNDFYDLTPTERREEQNIDGAFTTAETRLDQMGVYAFTQSHKYGLLGTFMAAEVVLGLVLVADWLTMEDDRVCEDCQAMAEAGPYPVALWPPEQHFGDRCYPGDVYIRE